MPSYGVKALENTQSILCGLFLVCEHFSSGRTASHRTALDFRGIFVLLDAGGLSPAKEKRAKSTEKTGCPTCVPLLIDASIYVDRACRGSGVGQKLYTEIERLGRERGIENLISIITSDNEGSLRFHRKNGFTEIGVMPAVAFKFGKYLDVSFFQKHLG